MCDFFWERLDNTDQGGDLADIVRSVSAGGGGGDLTAVTTTDCASWQFPTDPADDFGDGFGLRDPLLHELTGTTAVFDGRSGPDKSGSVSGGGGGGRASTTTVSDHQLLAAAHHHQVLIGDEMKRPCSNLFSQVLQISPAKLSPLSPRAIEPLPMVPAHGHCDVDKLEHGVQISSPRAPGIKRRKSQAKKVVCIPAPAAASNRPSGEVVPSDLWAWRKYGQKPIKGSPYPRGYYRCSSSKGCSARKQVERSRTNPNMLVITYTSEHNHPWPTQRNALAGSTRSQPTKNSATASSASASKSSPRQPTTTPKEEHKETTTTTTTSSSSLPALVKEEVVTAEMENDATMEAQMGNDHDVFDHVFYNEPINQSDDFFADLAELEPDPMSLIFSRSGFMGDHNKPDEEEKESCSKGLDPFINMFDWGGSSSSSSFGDQSTKKEESL